ncbi:MAG: hypothetical protein H6719_08165 [Sandaracinaceae bacterium]|nr:hypothetical protein [Sandaracinaceae bacterium]
MEVTRVPCEACGSLINDRFAKCPLCGATRRPSVEVRPTSLDGGRAAPDGQRVTLDGRTKEQRLAAAADPFGGGAAGPVTGASTGLLSAIAPSNHTRGWMRTAEIVLTVISFPFFVTSMVGILFQGVKRWGRIDAMSWVGGAFFGSLVLGLGLWLAGVSPTVTWWIVGIGFGAWTARGVLRFVAAAQRLGDHS